MPYTRSLTVRRSDAGGRTPPYVACRRGTDNRPPANWPPNGPTYCRKMRLAAPESEAPEPGRTLPRASSRRGPARPYHRPAVCPAARCNGSCGNRCRRSPGVHGPRLTMTRPTNGRPPCLPRRSHDTRGRRPNARPAPSIAPPGSRSRGVGSSECCSTIRLGSPDGGSPRRDSSRTPALDAHCLRMP